MRIGMGAASENALSLSIDGYSPIALLGVDFIPWLTDGKIRSGPDYTPLLRSL